jgi:selenide,water dikinase
VLAEVLRALPPIADPNVLVGTETSDDAAVYRLSDELALVLTLDYFTPIVDDPYAFGQIAAANALSDVYAMGGRPLAMLSIVGFPRDKLPLGVLGEILKGGAEKGLEAGVNVVGGHSIDDPEPKVGYAVTGVVHPAKVWKNVGARPRDALILTKPVGTGIISTAIKQEQAPPAAVEAAIRTMGSLNRAAAEAVAEVGAHAVTDVTGFGLLGHLREMTVGSGVRARLVAGAVALLPDVVRLAQAGIVPGGTRRNLRAVDAIVRWDPAITETWRLVLADAQTSGGLLVAVPDGQALLRALARRGVTQARQVGEVLGEDPAGTIEVAP